jgi:hypothetical protein
VNPSFLGVAATWQYGQFWTRSPAPFACVKSWGVAAAGRAGASEARMNVAEATLRVRHWERLL